MTDIFIVGLGVMSVQQVTRETEQAIAASNEVLYLDTGVATEAYLRQHCARVTPLYASSYRESQHRLNAYHHMGARVVDAALRHPPVTFAIHGHPLVAVYSPFLVSDLAHVLGLRVRILPGISAMDTIFAELRVDPCIDGVQMFEATDLLLRRTPLRPDVPALIWQIGNLESRLHSTKQSRPVRFERFTRYLLQFHPADHQVIAIYTPPHPLMPSEILRFALSTMPEHADRFHTGFSLYVPPSRERPIRDADLLAQVDSPAHLKRITR